MRIKKRIAFVYSSVFMLFKKHPLKRILIIGQMRSGSSLLSHILFNNSEITGIGETHNVYKNNKYHTKLLASILMNKHMLSFPSSAVYAMDKVLHDYILDESILADKNTLIILLVRAPEEVISSILNLNKSKPETFKKAYTFNDAKDYYIKRLKYILDIKGKYGKKCFFVDYGDFLVNNEKILNDLTTFLNLKQPLTASYKLTKLTGRPIIGDSSENISSGRILSNDEKKKEKFVDPEINDESLKDALDIYNKVREVCAN